MRTTIAIALLVVVVLVTYGFKKAWGPSEGTGPHDRVLADFHIIRAGLDTYRTNAGHYPTTEQGLEALVKRPTSDPQPKQWMKLTLCRLIRGASHTAIVPRPETKRKSSRSSVVGRTASSGRRTTALR